MQELLKCFATVVVRDWVRPYERGEVGIECVDDEEVVDDVASTVRSAHPEVEFTHEEVQRAVLYAADRFSRATIQASVMASPEIDQRPWTARYNALELLIGQLETCVTLEDEE